MAGVSGLLENLERDWEMSDSKTWALWNTCESQTLEMFLHARTFRALGDVWMLGSWEHRRGLGCPGIYNVGCFIILPDLEYWDSFSLPGNPEHLCFWNAGDSRTENARKSGTLKRFVCLLIPGIKPWVWAHDGRKLPECHGSRTLRGSEGLRADQDPRDDIETAWEILALMGRDWERGTPKSGGMGSQYHPRKL